MNVQLKRSTSQVELLQILKILYPSAKILIEKHWIRLIIENQIFIIVLNERNELNINFLTLWPSIDSKIVAQEIKSKIVDFFENGSVNQDVESQIPTTCPHCKSPNEKKILVCEWCGGKVM